MEEEEEEEEEKTISFMCLNPKHLSGCYDKWKKITKSFYCQAPAVNVRDTLCCYLQQK